MKFIETPLQNAYTIDLNPFQDERGAFIRAFCKKEFEEIGHSKEFVQINHSINKQKGTIRGMHFQKPPFAEIKLIRCIRGSIFDVIIDVRKNSPTFLHSFGVELSAENLKMMYVPEGFAHGFQTLENECEVLYHHTEYYNPTSEDGLRFDDKILNIQWKLKPENISVKDLNYKMIDNNFIGLEL